MKRLLALACLCLASCGERKAQDTPDISDPFPPPILEATYSVPLDEEPAHVVVFVRRVGR